MAKNEAFMEHILKEPENDTPRLIYADWLDEYGNENDQVRAEFIRAQCAIRRNEPNTVEMHQRVELILKEHKAAWLAHLPQSEHSTYEFGRGFVEIVQATRIGLTLLHDIVKHEPVLELQLDNPFDYDDNSNEYDNEANHTLDIQPLDVFSRLRRIRSDGYDNMCVLLADANAYLTKLQSLTLGTSFLSSDLVQLVEHERVWPSLEFLDLSGNPIGAVGDDAVDAANLLRGITSQSLFPRLKSIDLSHCLISFHAARQLEEYRNARSDMGPDNRLRIILRNGPDASVPTELIRRLRE